ncbi:hypothetical protein [Mycoplasma procyoni]|uniref:hypothetical protein n=1 Tax=Mycoplasma procyoni TaxID=568784 RepID=UPI00197C2989|nr:hypothetical protein [Mycoplasma procyoni]MBN3534900.1 hypothetical protein [Mycoplasma procyoni]
MKKLLLGKPPLERKYLPKIEEHLYAFFSSIFYTIALVMFILLFVFNQEKTFSDKFFSLLNTTEFRIVISMFVFVLLVNIIYTIRLVRILPKTEEGIILVYLEIFLLTTVVLSFLNLIVSLTCLKYNEIVFE